MAPRNILRLGFILIIFIAIVSLSFDSLAQTPEESIEALKKTAPKVYIDCFWCDQDYIRTEITFVNYVRDRKEAQIHILITTRSTGGGGKEYTLFFMGQNEFEGINDTHKFFTEQNATADEIRAALVQALKVGLMSYVAKTPIARRIKIDFKTPPPPREEKDKWNYWLFNLSLNGNFNGEKRYAYRSLQTSFSANQVTEELKIQLSLSLHHTFQRFSYVSREITSSMDIYDFNGLVVKAINDHWSIGGYLRATSSTYENIKFELSPAPAIEYNVFPYSQSSRRQLRFLYRVGFNTVNYREETIYDKLKENLWRESLSATLDLKEKWGSISTTLAGSHYFHDFKKNRLTLFSVINLRLVKGLNFFIFGGGSRIHDQLSLPKGGASFEEILLRRKQIETNYTYWFSVGLSYTFGSIFTNVVNPRFGSSGHGGLSIIIH
ncbi:MAG: hypothetical protein J7L26_09175 [Candidatus Aminicenantes bacterium]|nr:hypothetical protein [Candidatus Aminicenantes bacterium]